MSNFGRQFLYGVSYIKGDPGHMFISTMKKRLNKNWEDLLRNTRKLMRDQR
jgi:hypothetical protein